MPRTSQIRRHLIAAALASCALALPTAGLAGPPGHGGRAPGPEHIGRLLDRIGANDETRAAVEAIAAESHAEGEHLRDEVDRARHALRDLMRAEPVDRDAVLTLAEELGRLESEARVHRIDTMLRIREQLTPEQRTQLESMHEARHAAVLEACKEDLASLCPDSDPEDGREMFHCLMPKRDEVSAGCREALPDFRRGKGGERGKGHGRDGDCGGPPGAEPPPEL